MDCPINIGSQSKTDLTSFSPIEIGLKSITTPTRDCSDRNAECVTPEAHKNVARNQDLSNKPAHWQQRRGSEGDVPSKPIPDRFLNYSEVAEMIGVDVETLRKGKCQTNEIPRIRLGHRKVLFSLLAVQRWMAAKAREAEEAKQHQANVVDLMASKIERQRAVRDTLTTIINGGRYER